MNKYGQAAIKAVRLIAENQNLTPIEAWEIATIMIFGKNNSGQAKSCPRNTFLALCETGRVKNVPLNDYTTSVLNKRYALDALKLLEFQPELSDNPMQLWKSIPHENAEILHNSQMNVVVALWNENLIQH
jgi:hypothetical protein